MRSKSRTITVALVAMLTLGAIMAGSASAALPEFTKIKGQFTGAPKLSFESDQRVPWYFSNYGSKFSGELTGSGLGTQKLGNISMTLTEGSEWACHNRITGNYNRELVLTGLQGRLGYINKTAKTVGLMLEPTKQPFGTCIFHTLPRTIAGEVIAKITPIFTRTKTFKLVFEEGPAGIQKPVFFDGEAEKFPTTFPLSSGNKPWKCLVNEEFCSFGKEARLGIYGELTITTPELMEIRA